MRKLILSCFLFSCLSCGMIDKAIDMETIAINAIDDAISSLSFQSDQWRSLLETTLDKIPEEVQSIIRQDMQNLITESVAVAGVELRCNVDFFRSRLIRDLRNIKNKILKRSVIPGEPEICQSYPDLIDMNLAPNHPDRNKISFTGYDLKKDNIRLFLESDGVETEVTNSLSKNSNYQLTANLGSNGITVDSNSDKIILKAAGSVLSEIPVIQRVRNICKSKPVRLMPDKHTVIPTRIKGDDDFGGNGPVVECSVKLKIGNNGGSLIADIFMSAKETKSDWTTLEKTESIEIYKTQPGWKIENIVSVQESRFAYTDTDHTIDSYPIGQGPVSKMVFVGDVGGPDAGNTHAILHFRNIDLMQKETDDCQISEFMLAKALSTGKLSTEISTQAMILRPTMMEAFETIEFKEEGMQ